MAGLLYLDSYSVGMLPDGVLEWRNLVSSGSTLFLIIGGITFECVW